MIENIAISEISDKAALSETTSKDFNPDTRIDVLKKRSQAEICSNGFNPNARIETTKKCEPKHISCPNEKLLNQTHPETGVHFREEIVSDEFGRKLRGVFPEFDSFSDAKLPDEMLQSSDRVQFNECNLQLKEKISNDPGFCSKFTANQIEQIKNGDTPDGYTWHHNEEIGKMQLVDAKIHAKTAHMGGRTIWGGGSGYR